MQKIKRTDVRRKGGRKSVFRIVLVILFLFLLFLIGFFAAAYITKMF